MIKLKPCPNCRAEQRNNGMDPRIFTLFFSGQFGRNICIECDHCGKRGPSIYVEASRLAEHSGREGFRGLLPAEAIEMAAMLWNYAATKAGESDSGKVPDNQPEPLLILNMELKVTRGGKLVQTASMQNVVLVDFDMKGDGQGGMEIHFHQ